MARARVDVGTTVLVQPSETYDGEVEAEGGRYVRYRDDAATQQNLARSRNAAGHDVIVHATHDAAGEVQFMVNGNFTNVHQIADAVLANPAYRGGPVNLVTCFGACGPAQELGGILGVRVTALPGKADLHPVTGLLRGW